MPPYRNVRVLTTGPRLVAYGTDFIEGSWSFQALLVAQFAFVGVILAVWPFFPESPYWHIQNGRLEEARRSFERIHGRGDQVLICAEMDRIREVIRSSEELAAEAGARGPVYVQIFQGPNLVSHISLIPRP